MGVWGCGRIVESGDNGETKEGETMSVCMSEFTSNSGRQGRSPSCASLNLLPHILNLFSYVE